MSEKKYSLLNIFYISAIPTTSIVATVPDILSTCTTVDAPEKGANNEGINGTVNPKLVPVGVSLAVGNVGVVSVRGSPTSNALNTSTAIFSEPVRTSVRILAVPIPIGFINLNIPDSYPFPTPFIKVGPVIIGIDSQKTISASVKNVLPEV